MNRLIAICLLAAFLCLACAPVAYAATAAEASTPLTDRSRAMLNNIDRAIRKANGTYVSYGEEYSFNDVVGPRGTAQGYQKAENGRGSEVIAGGVSHVATTIYLAVKKLGGDITITEKQVYGRDFVQSYVSSGNDAIATAWSNQMDFRFINYYGDFTIEVWRDSERMYCRLETQSRRPQPTRRPDPYFQETMYVFNCESYISLRAYPDTGAERLARIPYRSQVTVLGWAENGFYRVRYDGQTGYALSEYLSTRRPPERLYSTGTTLYVYNCDSYISLREYDSTGAPRITTIPYGETVVYLDGAYDGFGKVSYRGLTGYALTSYLTTRRPYIPDYEPGYRQGTSQVVEPDQSYAYDKPNQTDAYDKTDWRRAYREYIRRNYDGNSSNPWIWAKLIDFTFDGTPEMVVCTSNSNSGRAEIVLLESLPETFNIPHTSGVSDDLFFLYQNTKTSERIWLYKHEYTNHGVTEAYIFRCHFSGSTFSYDEIFLEVSTVDPDQTIRMPYKYMGETVSEAEYNRQYKAFFDELEPLDFTELTVDFNWNDSTRALELFDELCAKWDASETSGDYQDTSNLDWLYD